MTQNALRLHFGVPLSDERGYVAKALELHDWSQCVLSAGSNILSCRMAMLARRSIRLLTNTLSATPISHPWAGGIIELSRVDYHRRPASGPSPALTALTSLADLHLVPPLADTASMSTLSHGKQRLTGGKLNHKLGHFVLNQSDNRRQVSRDVTALMEDKLGDRLLVLSIAMRASLKRMLPRSRFSTLALPLQPPLILKSWQKKISALLGIKIGDGTVHSQPSYVRALTYCRAAE